MSNYKSLTVWERAFDLSLQVYQVTKKFPKDEQFGLTSQIRRCAVSVFSNIAEGHGRNSELDFVRFLNIAMGSCNELEGQLLLAQRLEYLEENQAIMLLELCAEVKRMMAGLISKIKRA